jgi:hypothetical protein
MRGGILTDIRIALVTILVKSLMVNFGLISKKKNYQTSMPVFKI